MEKILGVAEALDLAENTEPEDVFRMSRKANKLEWTAPVQEEDSLDPNLSMEVCIA